MLYTEEQKKDHIEEILQYLYQIALRDSRIPIIVPGREFGDEAALAVRAYQEAYGLPVTGEIDDGTWNSIVNTYRALMDTAAPLIVFPSGKFLLQAGDSCDLVQLVQVLINLASKRYVNLPSIPASGIFDSATEDAIRNLQRIASLEETGVLDRKTWNVIAALINSMPLSI